MTRFLISVASVSLWFVSSLATAQPMAAMKGTPLPASELAPGTISVRVVAGKPSDPVPGVDVTLTVNGTAREARSDSEGRVFFKDLPINATVQAKIKDQDGKDVESETFPVPSESGVKLMLSTRPLVGGGMAEGAMPEPRKASGIPRPDDKIPAGTYAVRVTYDDLKEKEPPAGIDVELVGYSADDKVTFQRKQTGADGHVQFDGLDRSGQTAYYAMTTVKRGAIADRLMTQPMTMTPQVGAIVLLSSEKRDSTAATIDDVGGAPEPTASVVVALEGKALPGDTQIVLVDPESNTVVARTTPQPGPPDPTQIQGEAPFEAKSDLPAGTLDVEVHGGLGTAVDPLPHVGVRLIPGDATSLPPGDPTAETDAAGKTRVTVKPGIVRAVLKINRREIPTDTIDLTKSGGVLHVTAQWPEHGKPVAILQITPRAGQVVYAEVRAGKDAYRSRPFPLVEDRGAHISIAVLPRILMSFSLTSHVDDAFLAVQGRFEVYNNSWIPYTGGGDGLVIQLPRGFKGGILADQDQADVAVSAGEGFRIVRPLAPGVRQFIGGFSLPVEGGKVDWSMDLPYGTFQSGIEIQEERGMNVKPGGNVTVQHVTDKRGSWFVLAPISIHEGQSMQMTITGMPSAPAWRVWVPRLIGVLVLGMLGGGLAIALAMRRRAAAAGNPARDARRQRLLDELVALEQAGAQTPRREQIVAELEKLWEDK